MRLGRNVARMGETIKWLGKDHTGAWWYMSTTDSGATVCTFINLIKRHLLMKTAMIFGFRWGSEYSKLNKYLILPLNSHHTSMRPFRATAGNASFSALSLCCESWVHADWFVCRGHSRCWLTIFKETPGMISFGFDACITSAEQIVHCTSKCYKLSQPTGSD